MSRPKNSAPAQRGLSKKSYVTTGKRTSVKDVPVVKIIGEYLPLGYSLCIQHRLIVSPPSYNETPWHNCVRCGSKVRKV